MRSKVGLGALLMLGCSCGTIGPYVSYTVSITPEDAKVTDMSMEYGDFYLPLSQLSGAPPVKDEVFLQWRDAGGTLHRARVDILDRLPSPPPNGESYWVRFRITSDNQVKVQYQSKSYYDLNRKGVVAGDDAWYDLASSTTMLPVEDPRDQPVVRKHLVSKRDRPQFKSRQEDGTYIGPEGLFRVDLEAPPIGPDVELGERTIDWPLTVDLPAKYAPSPQVSSVTVSSLSNGMVFSVSFRDIMLSDGVLEAAMDVERDRFATLSSTKISGYEPSIRAATDRLGEFVGYVLPNQEFHDLFPHFYPAYEGNLETVGVSRFYVVRDHLIQVAAILPLPSEGMTPEEAKEYGLAEMESIMEAITFPGSEG